jgi:hypothetical protein
MPPMRGWRVLLLYLAERPSALRMTTHQHLRALERLPSPSQVLTYNAASGAPAWLRRLNFDAVVLHTTFLCIRWYNRFPELRRSVEWLADIDAAKVAFPQDDYERGHLLDDWLDELGVTAVCTPLPGHASELYPRLSRTAAFYHALTGYLDKPATARFAALAPAGPERALNIAYRARRLPYWIGSHGQLKHLIGEAVLDAAPKHGLACDISTRPQETILGQAWLDFMASARATIGAESGSSVLDGRGAIRRKIESLLDERPDLSFEEVAEQMPPGWDDYRFFALSPRHFEAVATKTAQILVEGQYSGVLEPERHYLPVRRDFSDLDEVLERARDRNLLAQVAEQAYEDIYERGDYGTDRLTRLLEEVLREHAGSGRGGGAAGVGFQAAARAARAQGAIGRFRVPARHLLTLRPGEQAQALAALRLVLSDPALARLVLDYLLASDVREHVPPRQALRDILALGGLRRRRDGRLDADVDEAAHRIVLRSAAASDGAGLSASRLRELLERGPLEFLWAGGDIPVTRKVEVPMRGNAPASLPMLSFLGRRRPGHVAAAVAGLFTRR